MLVATLGIFTSSVASDLIGNRPVVTVLVGVSKKLLPVLRCEAMAIMDTHSGEETAIMPVPRSALMPVVGASSGMETAGRMVPQTAS